jgi:7,8-dihydroneopterin aldolase/epimerase/oxygenase
MTQDWPLSQALGLRRLLEQAGASSYRIRVVNLELPCSIGIYDHERQHLQRVRINVELDVVDPGSFVSEDFAKVLNYESIVGGVKAIIAEGHVALVETLAERIAALCLGDPRAMNVRIAVDKLDAYCEAEGVGVSILRSRARH